LSYFLLLYGKDTLKF